MRSQGYAEDAPGDRLTRQAARRREIGSKSRAALLNGFLVLWRNAVVRTTEREKGVPAAARKKATSKGSGFRIGACPAW